MQASVPFYCQGNLWQWGGPVGWPVKLAWFCLLRDQGLPLSIVSSLILNRCLAAAATAAWHSVCILGLYTCLSDRLLAYFLLVSMSTYQVTSALC